MTYLEKYLELNPDATKKEVVETKCPSEVFNILGESDNYCVFNDTSNGTDDCKHCWMRTYRNESERDKERNTTVKMSVEEMKKKLEEMTGSTIEVI